MLLGAALTPAVHAQDARSDSASLSDRAFRLLNSLTAPAGSNNPALGPVASFAGDAQALSTALGSGNQADASSAMAALIADRKAVDDAVSAHPGSLNIADWNSLKQELDRIAMQVKPATVASAPGGAGAATAAAPAAGGDSPGSAPAASDIPTVRIDSYSVTGHTLRIKGILEGVALKSAGIYYDDKLVQDLKIEQIPGRQRINFDVELGQVEPGMMLKVFDGAGLSAEAPIATHEALQGTGSAKEVEIEPSTEGPVALGAEVASVEKSVVVNNGRSNVAEISSSSSIGHAGSAVHSHVGDLGISVISATLEDSETRSYDVVGQVTGTDLLHAGIYIDGKLVRPIDVDAADSYTIQPFDESFRMTGHKATVRVYDSHEQYVESALHLTNTPSELPGDFPVPPPMVAINPNRLSVQISSIVQSSPTQATVSGVISGKNLAAAGVFQNGVQVQSLSVSGGLIDSFRPSWFRQVKFTAQVNTTGGRLSVRVFDSNGQFAEAPIVPGGSSPPLNPTVPYAANPYAAPYAGNPYAAPPNPYGPGSPYGPRYGSPYGYPQPGYPPPPGYYPQSNPPPSSSSAPWWSKFLH